MYAERHGQIERVDAECDDDDPEGAHVSFDPTAHPRNPNSRIAPVSAPENIASMAAKTRLARTKLSPSAAVTATATSPMRSNAAGRPSSTAVCRKILCGYCFMQDAFSNP